MHISWQRGYNSVFPMFLQHTMALKDRRIVLPAELDGLQPMRFSQISGQGSRTVIFLSGEDARKLDEQLREIKRASSEDGLSRMQLRAMEERLMSDYSSKSPYFLKRMGDREAADTIEINSLLAQKGIPVLGITGRHGFRAGSNYMLMPRVTETLAHIQRNGDGVSYGDMDLYFDALGTLHSFSIRHNHPHFANAFKAEGKVGLFDFDRITRAGPDFDWKRYDNVMGFFYPDYHWALSMVMRVYEEDTPGFREAFHRDSERLFNRLVEPLPAAKDLKGHIAGELNEEFREALFRI